MKKLILFFLCISFAFANIAFETAKAEVVYSDDVVADYAASYTLEELRQLARIIGDAILLRGGSLDLQPGMYVAGVDFPVGTCTVSTDSEVVVVSVYRSANDYFNNEYSISIFDAMIGLMFDIPSTGNIIMNDGALLIVNDPVTLHLANAHTAAPSRPQLPTR